MMISGLQKLTLLDYPGKVACTAFFSGCNLRCPFCHNSPLVTGTAVTEGISREEFIDFLKKRAKVLDGVCISGGEPLLQKDITDLALEIKSLGYSVKIDTNGTFPDVVKKLIALGAVDMFAMDIKSAPDRYGIVTGASADISAIRESVNILLSSGIDYEFRTTFVKPLHSEYDAKEISLWIKGAKAYYLQSYKDSGMIINSEGLATFSEHEMKHFLSVVQENIPSAALRGI